MGRKNPNKRTNKKLHTNITKFHINMIMLHVGIIYLAYTGQKNAGINYTYFFIYVYFLSSPICHFRPLDFKVEVENNTSSKNFFSEIFLLYRLPLFNILDLLYFYRICMNCE